MTDIRPDDLIGNPQLLGHAFEPADSWSTWRTILKGAFGALLDDDEAAMFLKVTGRTKAPTTACRELWIVAGRRSGKTRIGSLLAVHAAMLRPHRLSAGEVGVVMLLASDRRQAKVARDYIAGLLSVPPFQDLVVDETRDAIRLSNSTMIEVHTSSFRSVRGYTIVACIADELAFWPSDETSADPDREIIAAIRPSLASSGGLLVCLSSPYARRGEIWTTHERHFGKDDDDVLVVQAPTLTLNPTIPRAIIERARADDSVVASSEWDAEFRRDIETFISQETVLAAVDSGCVERGPVDGIAYMAFCDPAGGSGSDSMTIAISHSENGTVFLDAVREVKPPFSPEQTVAAFAELLKKHHVATIVGDAYAGSWPSEQFQKHSVAYRTSPDPKSRLYLQALPLFNSGKVRLLDNQKLQTQLLGLERKTSRGGQDSVDHGPRNHDDVINAAVGSILLASKKAEPVATSIVSVSRTTRRDAWSGEDPVFSNSVRFP